MGEWLAHPQSWVVVVAVAVVVVAVALVDPQLQGAEGVVAQNVL